MGSQSPACGLCGYDLRGLPEGSTCPECGTAGAANPLLRHRPRPWLVRVADGFGLHAGVYATAAAFGLVTEYASFPAHLRGVTQLLWMVVPFTLVFLHAAAVFRVASPQWGVAERIPTLRRAVKVTTGAATGSLTFVVMALQPALSRYVEAIFNGIAGLGLAAFVLWFFYVGRLAGQLPDPRLTRRARVACGVFTAFWVLLYCHVYAWEWVPALQRVPAALWYWGSSAVVTGVFLVWLYAAYLCLCFYRRLRALIATNAETSAVTHQAERPERSQSATDTAPIPAP